MFLVAAERMINSLLSLCVIAVAFGAGGGVPGEESAPVPPHIVTFGLVFYCSV